jgi:hypothetical protein
MRAFDCTVTSEVGFADDEVDDSLDTFVDEVLADLDSAEDEAESFE